MYGILGRLAALGFFFFFFLVLCRLPRGKAKTVRSTEYRYVVFAKFAIAKAKLPRFFGTK